jgi:hypothetical protein
LAWVRVHALTRRACRADRSSCGLRGTGWAFTDSLFTNLVPLWIGARGMEFRWDYLEMAVISNLNMVRSPAPAARAPARR